MMTNAVQVRENPTLSSLFNIIGIHHEKSIRRLAATLVICSARMGAQHGLLFSLGVAFPDVSSL
jgi:hypothetical protein